MADKYVSDLPAASALLGTEILHVVQGGNSRKATTQAMANLATMNYSYEAGPPGTVPAVADLTWVNQGTSTITEGSRALILKAQSNSVIHGMDMAAPSAPFDIYMRVDTNGLSTAANTVSQLLTAGIMLTDGSDSERVLIQRWTNRVAGDEQNEYGVALERWNNITFSANVFTRRSTMPWQWLRATVDSTTITIYCSMDGRNWHLIATEALSAYIDAVTRVGFYILADTNVTEAYALISYFSFTPPV